MLLDIDELNVVLSQTTDDGIKQKDYSDTVLDMLIMAYVYGNTDANISLNRIEDNPVLVSMDKAVEYIGAVIEDKTTKERLDEYVRQGDVESIKRVIVTEAHRMYNQGAYDTAKEAGATSKEWVCQMIPTSRDTHVYLNGTKVGIDDAFYTFNGNQAQFPGQFGVAEEDVNCLCEVRYSMD